MKGPALISSQPSAGGGQRRRLVGLLAILFLSLAPAAARAGLQFHLATTAGLTLSHNPIHPGEPLTLTGRVRDLSGAPVAAGLVRLELADAPEGPWTLLDQGPPDEAGDFQTVDYTLGLETRPFYVRVCYPGGEAGKISYGEAVSPVIPVVARPAGAGREALRLGFVKAQGDGQPGRPGAGPWEFTLKVTARQEVHGVMVQGSSADWTTLNGAAWHFQADTGRVAARALEGESGETLISWELGFLAPGQEATLKIVVDGVLAPGGEAGDAALPLGGLGVMHFRAAVSSIWPNPPRPPLSSPGPRAPVLEGGGRES